MSKEERKEKGQRRPFIRETWRFSALPARHRASPCLRLRFRFASASSPPLAASPSLHTLTPHDMAIAPIQGALRRSVRSAPPPNSSASFSRTNDRLTPLALDRTGSAARRYWDQLGASGRLHVLVRRARAPERIARKGAEGRGGELTTILLIRCACMQVRAPREER